MSGALTGVRVVELGNKLTARAGKLLADLGADVIVVEPRGGSVLRRQPPFVDDVPHPERSLAWWADNTNKRSIELDLQQPPDRDTFGRLVEQAAIVIEGEPPGALDALEVGYATQQAKRQSLVWVTVANFDPDGPRANEPATDLTLLAGGGPVWACGYSDHSLPPVRGGGDQSEYIGAVYAAIGALSALAEVDAGGPGNRVVVNLNAAVNVTVEQNTYTWLVYNAECRRQTGRHAAPVETQETQVRCADGRYATTGVPPRRPDDFGRLHKWLDDAGLLPSFPEAVFLEMAAARSEAPSMALVGQDEEASAIMEAAREGLTLLAQNLSAMDFFLEGQRRNFAVGIIYSPEEAFEDEHFKARGFQHDVDHPEIGRCVRYPGAPYKFSATPWSIRRRAPFVGEHTDEIIRDLAERPKTVKIK